MDVPKGGGRARAQVYLPPWSTGGHSGEVAAPGLCLDRAPPLSPPVQGRRGAFSPQASQPASSPRPESGTPEVLEQGAKAFRLWFGSPGLPGQLPNQVGEQRSAPSCWSFSTPGPVGIYEFHMKYCLCPFPSLPPPCPSFLKVFTVSILLRPPPDPT